MSTSALQLDEQLVQRGRLRVDPGVVTTITLDRPESRNSQLGDTWEALAHIGSRITDEVRVVVVRGAGPTFSAGLDRSAWSAAPDSMLGALAAAPDTVGDAMIAAYQAGFTWLSDPAFISVAAVQGFAIGAGFQLALACDLLIATDDAQFSMAEVTLGLVPDLTGSGRLVAAVGRQRALEICATGRRVGAAEAVQIGIALMSVPAGELDAAVTDLVTALLGADAEAVRAVTRLINGAPDRTRAEQLSAERAEQHQRVRALARQASGRQ